MQSLHLLKSTNFLEMCSPICFLLLGNTVNWLKLKQHFHPEIGSMEESWPIWLPSSEKYYFNVFFYDYQLKAVYTPPQVSEFLGEENGEFAQRGSSLHWRKFCFYRSFTIYVAQWVFVNLCCWGVCSLICQQFLYLATATAGKSLEQRGHQSSWGWWPQSSACGSLCCQQVLISCTVSGILHRMDLFSSTCCLAIVVQPCSCLSLPFSGWFPGCSMTVTRVRRTQL